MSHNYYSEINLHIVWRTKNNLPLLTPEAEPTAHRAIKHRITKTSGAFIHEINGTQDHVHLAVTIPPTLTISDWIGQLKGGSSHDVNGELGKRGKVLQWQAGYGVVSFGTQHLEWVKQYIQNQKEHHASGTAVDRLERITQIEHA